MLGKLSSGLLGFVVAKNIYGVAPKGIRQIKNGEIWRHVYEKVYGSKSDSMDTINEDSHQNIDYPQQIKVLQ